MEQGDQSYTLAQTALTYTVPAFTVDPTFCPFDYSTSATPFTGTSTAITHTNAAPATAPPAFSVFWDTDLTPIDNTQTITVTATSTTVFNPTPANPTVVTDDHVLSFVNPCTDETLTTITTKAQTDPADNLYTGTDVIFTHTNFEVSPSFCPLTITCKSVVEDSVVTASTQIADFCPELTEDNGVYTLTQ